MLTESTIVITVVQITITGIMVMVTKDIMTTSISGIRVNIMVATVTSIDNITPGVTGIITVENTEIIGIVIISAIRVSRKK